MSPQARQLIAAAVLADEMWDRSNELAAAGYPAASNAAWETYQAYHAEARERAAEIIAGPRHAEREPTSDYAEHLLRQKEAREAEQAEHERREDLRRSFWE